MGWGLESSHLMTFHQLLVGQGGPFRVLFLKFPNLQVFFSVVSFRFELSRKQKIDLTLDDIILLDILQKNGQISKEAAVSFRKKKLIEGWYPKVCTRQKTSQS